MSKSWRIFWACAAGAGIGALIALDINGYFWWLGLIIGGLAGYLLYDIKVVVLAFPRAWRAASGWKLDRGAWKLAGLGTVAFVCVLLSSSSLILIGSYFGGRIDHVSTLEFFSDHKTSATALMVFLIAGVPGVLAIGVAGFSYMLLLSGASTQAGRVGAIEEIVSVIKIANPVAVFIYWPIVILWHLPAATWQAVMVTGRFAKHLFLAIHSDERLLCGIYAAIGAGIGYFAGSAIVGALAGGVFGVINYEVVSKHILGLNRA